MVNIVELYKLCSDQNKVNFTLITYIHTYFKMLFKGLHIARRTAQTVNYPLAWFLICAQTLYTMFF